MKLPPTIETARLIIRRHLSEDLEPFTEFMTDEEATRFLDFEPEQKTPEGVRDLLDFVIASYDSSDPVFALAIIDKETGVFMGSCGLSPLTDGEGVECYYSLLPKYWGWGFATEASLAMLYYAFEELKLPKVVAHMSEENTKAWRVALNLGMSDMGPCNYKGMPGCRRFEITIAEWRRLTAPKSNDAHPGTAG
jgi:RimJ/RimL family protein N-acetyltransferase